ncbi:sensor histidine kinase [Asticcacaulis taihuensis]|uniref:sensor histidine kinase n=1 Tax=Asticcacaulis taihuensis TaxID=260084 RepID=UPI003F7C82E0
MTVFPLSSVRSYLFPSTSDRQVITRLYRPLARGYFLVVIGYYLVVGICISPFLESGRTVMLMIAPRLSVSAFSLAAFWFTRGAISDRRLELWVGLVNLHIFINFLFNQTIEFRPEIQTNFEILLVLFSAVSPSLRVMAVCNGVLATGWIWLVAGHQPALMKPTIALVIVGIVVGVTIWGLIQSVLRSAARALVTSQQRGDELERFAFICSHDMQEPVRMMNIYAELLNETAASRLEVNEHLYLGLIRENAVRLQRMIKDILTFSRIGKDGLTLETVDTSAVLDTVLTEFDDQIRQTGATVTRKDLPVVTTSMTLMHVVLRNLIGNALKYRDADRPTHISIGAEVQKGMWRFEVSDNGIGIDPDFRDKMFVLFQRLNRKEDYPGSGIGLSTCRKFLHICGGEIDFDSVPGEGTTFFFTLPRTGDKMNAAA